VRQFNFKLEKLLEMKSHSEKKKSLELAEVTGRYLKIEGDIDQMRILKKQILTDRFKIADNKSSSLLYDEYQMSAIRDKILKLEKNLETVNLEREQVRTKYISALKDKKVMEKLKDKKEAEHKKEETARDARTLDDLVVTIFGVRDQEV